MTKLDWSDIRFPGPNDRVFLAKINEIIDHINKVEKTHEDGFHLPPDGMFIVKGENE